MSETQLLDTLKSDRNQIDNGWKDQPYIVNGEKHYKESQCEVSSTLDVIEWDERVQWLQRKLDIENTFVVCEFTDKFMKANTMGDIQFRMRPMVHVHIRIRNNVAPYIMLQTLCHEMIHASQMRHDGLNDFFDSDKGEYQFGIKTYRGENYKLTDVAYATRPWEIDAKQSSDKLAGEMREYFYKYTYLRPKEQPDPTIPLPIAMAAAVKEIEAAGFKVDYHESESQSSVNGEWVTTETDIPTWYFEPTEELYTRSWRDYSEVDKSEIYNGVQARKDGMLQWDNGSDDPILEQIFKIICKYVSEDKHT